MSNVMLQPPTLEYNFRTAMSALGYRSHEEFIPVAAAYEIVRILVDHEKQRNDYMQKLLGGLQVSMIRPILIEEDGHGTSEADPLP